MQLQAIPNDASGAGTSPQSASREPELLRAARAMIPALRERAPATENLRRIPDETENAFRAAGFYKVLQPRRHGGLEESYGIHTELAMEVGRGCVSSAWALSVTACHAWMLGMFPDEAQAEFWDGDPDRTVASTFLPIGPAVSRVDGGYQLSGRWRFSSNVDQCQGCLVLVPVPNEAGPPTQYFFLLHRDQYRIEDKWNVIGLAGTGSNDVVAEHIFVPAHRTLDIMTTREAQAPGAQSNTGALYNMPLFAPFAHSLVGAAVGGAQGALDVLLDELADKRSVAQVKLAEQQSVQLRIAEATAEIEAARAILKVDRAKIVDAASRRELPDYEQRVRYRLNTGYAAKLSVQAVERLLPLAGGRGLEREHPLQRAWRDVHAVGQHIALVWDLQALNYGAVRLGFKAADPRI